MVLSLKVLTVIGVFLSFWLISFGVLFLPTFFVRRGKKIFSFPTTLSLLLFVLGLILWIKGYTTCSGEECLGLVIWPYIVLGVVVGSYIFFLILGVFSKKYDWTLKKVVFISLIISIISIFVLHVVAPPKYDVDLNVVELMEKNYLENCNKAEFGLSMFNPRWQDSFYSYENLCYHDVALLTGNMLYCDKISSEKRENCVSDINLVTLLSKAKCNDSYNSDCVLDICKKYKSGIKSVNSIYNCVYIMTKKEPETCAIFGDYIPYIEHCKK